VKRYDVAHLDGLERVRVGEEGLTWRPVRRRLGIGAFGVNAYTAEQAGQEVIEDHTETSNRHEELYVVLTGHACFSLGEEHVEAPASTFVFIRDPELQRAIDLDGQLRAWARDDEDFSGLRDDPRFVSAVAGEPDADGPSS